MARKKVVAFAHACGASCSTVDELSLVPCSLSRSRSCTSTAGCRFSPSAWCLRARDHNPERDLSADLSSDPKLMRKKIWREFFSEPCQWWDKRSEKVNPRYPDFKCMKTQQEVCIIYNLTRPWVKAEMATERHVSPDPVSERKMMKEKLWRELFSNPSEWSDHRSEKANPRYPDFKHKRTGQGLWLDNNMTPSWVEAELATMAPGLLQSHSFSWNVRLRRHLDAKDYQKTLDLFQQIQRESIIMPDKFTFVAILNACANLRSLEEGKRVHEQILQSGCQSDIYVANCLVDMYAKCGSIEDAWTVFNKMQQRDVVSWSAMIVGYVKSEQGLKALELFREMQQEGVDPNTVTFLGALNACASLMALEEGRHVHKQIIQRGCESDVFVATCLVDMYATCGSIEDAWSVFNRMRERDVVSWNTMIGGYVQSEQGLKALNLFRAMQQDGVEPNPFTFVGVLNACASVAALEEGRRVHKQIMRRGCESDVFIANCLVDMYAKCGSIEDAWIVFNKMRERDAVSWSAMIVGYVKSEQGLKALKLFQKMQQEGVEPNTATFVGVLNACATVADLEEGRRVHRQIIRTGYNADVYVATCLVDMYAKCGSIEDAWSVFNKMQERDAVSWSAMIVGYVKAEQGLKALRLFRKMQQEGVEPNNATFVGVLNACAGLVALEEGRRVHKQIIGRGCESDVYIANCLVDMYAKCGSTEDAWRVFNNMQVRNVVSWGAMIGGYVKSEQGLKALELFQKMQQEGVEPDVVTFVGALNACASIVALQQGRRVHKQIIKRGWESDVYVATCLVDMYAKCGSTKDARTVFNEMRERDVVSWNAMIGGYSLHGDFKKAIELFKQMCKEGVKINDITFICLLSACSHGGLVEEGLDYFNTMTSHYNVLPTREHYVCIVDLLGRAGRLKEAEEKAVEMTRRMSTEQDSCVWTCLLGACRIHGNIQMAERAAKRCWELDPKNDSTHVLLSNIYAVAGKCDRSAAIEVGCLKRRCLVTGGQGEKAMDSFVAEDQGQTEIQQIHAEFDRLSVQLKEEVHSQIRVSVK